MLLRNRLLMAFMVMVFVALIVTGVVTTFLINNQFDAYLVKEHERKLEIIIELAQNAIIEESESGLGELSIYAVSENYFVEILNGNGQIVFETPNQLQNNMMGRNMSLSQMKNMPMYRNP